VGGISSLMNLGSDALSAQAFALNVTGQNVSNANTPGYVRRDALLQTQPITGGVQATGVKRSVDTFLQARTNDATSLNSGASTRDNALASVESLFNDAAGSGLSSSLDALFSSFNQLSATPNDPTVRSAVLNAASNFAQNVNTTATQLSTQRNDLLTQSTDTATAVNNLTSQVAKLNSQVALTEATGGDASDLKDQRDALVQQISQKVNVHSFTDSNGKLNVTIGGASLVQGDVANAISVGLATDGTMKISVGQSTGAADVTSQVTGGTLGGMKQARDVDIVAVQQKLDSFTYDVATAVNTQHAAGYGQDGNTGRNLFSVTGPTGAALSIAVDPAMVGRPDLVAAASTAATLPGGADNAVLLGQLANNKVASGSTRTADESYSDIVGIVGQMKASSAQDSTVRAAVLTQAQSMEDAVTGVSTDEEMVNLSRYQRAYEAASKLISTADELLAGLIQNL
jgi:flagellar hook-associated protein 1 FlgK